MGIPFQVRIPVSLQLKNSLQFEENEEAEAEEPETYENPEKLLDKAHEDAGMIVKEAELEALRIIKDAQVAAEESKKEIFDEAREQGYSDGYKQAVEQYEALVKEAEQTREQARTEYDEALAGMESDAVEMILAIAKKVIGEEMNAKNENILQLVRQAFEKCSNRESILLKVSPDDYDFIQENIDEITSQVTGIGELEIKKDPSLKSGGCIVETPFGSVDAGYETKLRKIEEAFIKALGKR
jgi:flagellar assembly protein FliH